MTLEEYLTIVENSEPDDWTLIHRPTFAQDLQQTSGAASPVPWIEVEEHDTLLSYRHDLAISIVKGLPHRDEFEEPWAKNFPDPVAISSWVDFRYNGVPVLRALSVHVDGARAELPLPDARTMEVSERQVRIWRLIDEASHGSRFDEYLHRAGLVATDKPWP